MLFHISLLLILPSDTLALVDCLAGFVGRMQASVEDQPLTLNDTAMCSAMYCIKVIIHSAIDDDGIFQQGISSRCAYTGGDRQVCQKNDGKCQDISFYDGMKGNFSFCCCQENKCNTATESELKTIYSMGSRTSRKVNSANFTVNLFTIISLYIFCVIFGFC
ncbi:hypothetical protein L3Y34_018115 [Caenorhabditis briggsae]|uniref:UPAR/Ly6 domain-containing protein n=1 Tax=Caenorhabditis briggsae TaxID=6238 RepID=A0AAE9DKG3_CAEBR|nr:hypothetical protein L3Y34_018115 [Caenorhabditis briggsae]